MERLSGRSPVQDAAETLVEFPSITPRPIIALRMPDNRFSTEKSQNQVAKLDAMQRTPFLERKHLEVLLIVATSIQSFLGTIRRL